MVEFTALKRSALECLVLCRSLDLGSEGIAGPVEISAPEREVTASKATLYTNVYSGPLQNKEFSEFNVQLTEVRSVANAASKDIGHLRGDLEKLKWQLKGSQGETQSAAPGPKTLGSRFDDEAAHSAMEARLKEIQYAPTSGTHPCRLTGAKHSFPYLSSGGS